MSLQLVCLMIWSAACANTWMMMRAYYYLHAVHPAQPERLTDTEKKLIECTKKTLTEGAEHPMTKEKIPADPRYAGLKDGTMSEKQFLRLQCFEHLKMMPAILRAWGALVPCFWCLAFYGGSLGDLVSVDILSALPGAFLGSEQAAAEMLVSVQGAIPVSWGLCEQIASYLGAIPVAWVCAFWLFHWAYSWVAPWLAFANSPMVLHPLDRCCLLKHPQEVLALLGFAQGEQDGENATKARDLKDLLPEGVKYIVIEVYMATGCPPCKTVAPIYSKMSAKYGMNTNTAAEAVASSGPAPAAAATAGASEASGSFLAEDARQWAFFKVNSLDHFLCKDAASGKVAAKYVLDGVQGVELTLPQAAGSAEGAEQQTIPIDGLQAAPTFLFLEVVESESESEGDEKEHKHRVRMLHGGPQVGARTEAFFEAIFGGEDAVVAAAEAAPADKAEQPAATGACCRKVDGKWVCS